MGNCTLRPGDLVRPRVGEVVPPLYVNIDLENQVAHGVAYEWTVGMLIGFIQAPGVSKRASKFALIFDMTSGRYGACKRRFVSRV